MSRARLFDTSLVVPAVTLASLAGVVFFVVLLVVGRPLGYSARLSEANAAAARIALLEKIPPSPTTFPPKAVCMESTPAAADALKRMLQSAATDAKVSVTSVALTPGSADQAGGLAPVTLRFEATGQYDAVLALISQMGRWQPELFVDSLDLRSQVSAISLKMEGRIFCSTFAHL